MAALRDIRSLLVATRRRLRLAESLAGVALALAVVGGGALALVLSGDRMVDLVAGGVGRVLVAALVVVAVAGVAGVALRPLLGWRRDEEVARAVDARAQTGDLLLSAVELGRLLPELVPGSEAARAVSPALVGALLERAAAECRRLDARRLVSLRPPRHRLLALAVVTAAWAVAALALPERFGRGFRALDVTRPPDAPPSAEPIVGDVELDLVYPAYMHAPPRTMSGTSGGILAPAGTSVTVRARALVPTGSATLTVEPAAPPASASSSTKEAKRPAAEVLPVEAKDGQLTAHLRVMAPGAYRFTLRPAASQPLPGLPALPSRAVREAEAHPIEIEADRPPQVELRAPADDLQVGSRRARVELGYTVEDDHGVGEVALVWRPADARGGDAEHRLVLRKAPAATDARPATDGIEAPAPPRSVADRMQWDLADVDLEPGVRVAYHVEARDNDDVTGPHVGRSRTLYLRIYSPREKHDELVTVEQSLVEHTVGLLGDRLELGRALRDKANAPPPQAEAAQRRTMQQKGAALVGELEKLLKLAAEDTLAPASLKATLAEMRARLARLLHADDVELERLGDPAGASASSPSLLALREHDGRHVAELEKDALTLDDLVSKQRLEQLVAIADEIAKSRDRLKQLLADYKKAPTEEGKRAIERELRELERRMAELTEKAQRLRGEVPDEYLNRDALKDADARRRLDAVRDLLDKGNVDEAMSELDRLSQQIDRMQKELDGNLRGFRGERFSAEEKAMADLENRLADLEQDERRIAEESRALEEKARREGDAERKGLLDPGLKQAEKMAEELERRVGPDNASLGPPAVGPSDQESLERVRRSASDLKRALGAGDVDEAHELAREAQRGLAELNFSLYAAEKREWVGARQAVRKARGEVAEAQALAKKLADDLEQATPRPGEGLSREARQKLDELEKRQQAARRRLDEARRELERRAREGQEGGGPSPSQKGQPGQAGQPAPSPGGGALGQADEGLREAGEHMQRAADGFGGRPDVRRGAAEAEAAAGRLGELRREVQKERHPEDGGGGGARNEVVKIPGADEAKGPREFRQDLLDAMKRSAPEQYKERVRRYYEELAR